MSDVKIAVAGIEMTPDQARRVYAELTKLFSAVAAPARPSILDRVSPTPPRPNDWGRYPDYWRPMLSPTCGPLNADGGLKSVAAGI